MSDAPTGGNDAAPDSSTSMMPGVDGGMDSSSPDAPVTTCGSPNQMCCMGNMCTGGSNCINNTCTCPGQMMGCNGTCLDLQTNGSNCGACGHDCFGGACTGGVCQSLQLATGQGYVTTIAIDTNGVYWGSGYPANGTVHRADRNGKNQLLLKDYGASSYTYVVGANNGFLYFNRSTSNVAGYMRCKLPDCMGGPAVVADNLASPYGAAIDAAGQRLYWARGTLYNYSPNGTILTAPLDGSQAPVQAISSGAEASPSQVRISGNTIYWINGGTYSSDNYQNNGAIRKAPLGVNQTASTVASLSQYGDPWGVVVDSMNAYATGFNFSGNDLIVAPLSGGIASPLVPMTPRINALFADSTGVFWAQDNSQLLFCKTTGCNQKGTKIADVGKISALTGDDKVLAWGTFDGFIYILAR